jgi:hypothetical protein
MGEHSGYASINYSRTMTLQGKEKFPLHSLMVDGNEQTVVT